MPENAFDSARAADVQRVLTGDGDALQRLIVYYHAALRAAVASTISAELRARLDPDDILQQAYVNAFKALHTQQPGPRTPVPRPQSPGPDPQLTALSPQSPAPLSFDGPAGFYKWVEAIAQARRKDGERALQRQKRDVAREVVDAAGPSTSYPDLLCRVAADQSTPSGHMAKEEATAAVMTCLARLTDDQRAVIRLRFLESRPIAEVAARLNKSEAAIHMLCHRGLKALREHMGSITHFLTRR